MRLEVIPIGIGRLETVVKGFEKGLEEWEIRGRIETFQTTALLRWTRILRSVLETWGHLLSHISENDYSDIGVKNSVVKKKNQMSLKNQRKKKKLKKWINETCKIYKKYYRCRYRNHHHYHVALPVRISQTIFRYPSLSSIAPERSSRHQHRAVIDIF